MAFWLHCNLCFQQGNINGVPKFYLGSCEHVFCSNCLQKMTKSKVSFICQICSKEIRSLAIDKNLNQSLQILFVNVNLNQIMRAINFRQKHKTHLTQHLGECALNNMNCLEKIGLLQDSIRKYENGINKTMEMINQLKKTMYQSKKKDMEKSSYKSLFSSGNRQTTSPLYKTDDSMISNETINANFDRQKRKYLDDNWTSQRRSQSTKTFQSMKTPEPEKRLSSPWKYSVPKNGSKSVSPLLYETLKKNIELQSPPVKKMNFKKRESISDILHKHKYSPLTERNIRGNNNSPNLKSTKTRISPFPPDKEQPNLSQHRNIAMKNRNFEGSVSPSGLYKSFNNRAISPFPENYKS